MDKQFPGDAFHYRATVEMPVDEMNLDNLEKKTRLIAAALNLRVQGKPAFTFYTGPAVTLVVFLAESHIIIGTYPEDGVVEFSMACCKILDPWRVEYLIHKYFGKVQGESDWHIKTKPGWGFDF